MNRRILTAVAVLIVAGALCLLSASAGAASPWYYSVTGPDGSNEIPPDKIGQILYFQFDATAPDYVWGNVRLDFDPTLLECVSIEESPDTDGFWTAWVQQTAELDKGGGGTLYYYDSTGYGSEWARWWVDHYGPLQTGPSGSYDNASGIIRLYVMTSAGGLNGSRPLRLGFRVKQPGTAVFSTYANDWTAFSWLYSASGTMTAASMAQASTTGQGYSWQLEDLPFRYTSIVKIAMAPQNSPPVAQAGPDVTAEMNSTEGASVNLDGSASTDPDGDALTYIWNWSEGSASGVKPTIVLPYGSTVVTLTVDDGKGGVSTDSVTINVADTSPPALKVTVSPGILWPPDHQYVNVLPSVIVSDISARNVQVTLLSVTSSEPDFGLGDGDTADDIVVNADGSIYLRSERSGAGSGRIYTITYKATDTAGNTTTSSASVLVPHHMGRTR